MIRQLIKILLRIGGRSLADAALQAGGRSALNAALGAAVDVVPRPIQQQAYTQVFNVRPPLTVYIRASHCRVSVRREPAPKVILQANLVRAFGLELAAEQDDAGVYIVARQKPVVGTLSRADLTVTVPSGSALVFHLTPGDVVLEDVNGLIELPPAPPVD